MRSLANDRYGVDRDDLVLLDIVQARRDTKAAKRLLTRLLKNRVVDQNASQPISYGPMAPPSARSYPMSNSDPIRV